MNMKRNIPSVLKACTAVLLSGMYQSCFAQQFYETIALATDKDNYHPADTLYASGVVLSPDAVQPSRISRYCTLELLNAKGEVVARQKVGCKDAIFHARIPLQGLAPSDFFLLRAYTRFMRNFSDTSWPMVTVGVNRPTQRPIIRKSRTSQRGVLQLSYFNKRIAYKYLAQDSLHTTGTLSIYTRGKKVAETEIRNQEKGYMAVPDSLAGATAYGLVTDKTTHQLLASRSVALQEQVSASFTLQVDRDSVATGKTFGITLQGGPEALCLTIRIEKTDDEARHPIQQGINGFTDKDAATCDSLLTGQYAYSFAPEQVLSLKGSVETEMGRTFKKGGTIVAFDNETGYAYESDIREDGTFEMGVDDFKDGTSFFLQAYNRKGKSNGYRILLPDDRHPGIHFPSVKWEERTATQADYSLGIADTSHSHWIPEVTVAAIIHRADTASNRFYKKNYMEREDIAEKGLVSLEAILRKMPGIRLQQAEEGNGTYIIPTRGTGSIPHGDTDNESMVSINIDGMWVEQTGKGIDLRGVIDPMEIQTIEYIPGSAAFAQYGARAFNGVIAIKTRSGKETSPVPSQGIRYQPEGLWDDRTFPAHVPLRSICLKAHGQQQIEWKAPLYAGRYRIVAEAISFGNEVVYRKEELTVLP